MENVTDEHGNLGLHCCAMLASSRFESITRYCAKSECYLHPDLTRQSHRTHRFRHIELLEDLRPAVDRRRGLAPEAPRPGRVADARDLNAPRPSRKPPHLSDRGREELLHGVIIMSGNDACIVLAQGISGSEDAFARRMTTLAHELGLTSANFKNTTGLEAVGHVISAEDLAKLAKLTIDKHPQYYDWYDMPSYTWREYTQANRNPLLSIEGTDGLKTGHLEVSGYGLTASAIRDGVRRTIVINGLESMAARAQEGERMMRMAFQSYDLKVITPESVELPEVKVWLGQQQTVPVSLASKMTIAGHKAALEKATSEIVLDQALQAPIKAGDTVGKLVVTVEGQAPTEAPIVAEATVKKLGFFGRAVEGLSQMIGGNNG